MVTTVLRFVLINFNSIKVRLKLCPLVVSLRLILNFNSIKVRLKRTHKHQSGCMSRFQFHKGTIKTRILNPVVSVAFEFQFHKGTIKTVPKNWSTLYAEFQFHKGTIKTHS